MPHETSTAAISRQFTVSPRPLLRERPVEAGIDPLFEVLDDLAGGLSFDAAYERFEHDLLETTTPELQRGLRRGFGLREVRQACEVLNRYRYLIPLQVPTTRDFDLGAVLRDFQAVADELRGILVAVQPPVDALVGIVEGIIEWIGRLVELPGESELEFALLNRSPAKTSFGKGKAANWGGRKSEVKELQQRYRDLIETTKQQLRTDALLGLLPALEGFVQQYGAERKAAGQPDFDDLLLWATELLRTSPAARDYFRRRFRRLVIDEFQDTDPVQAELVLLLTSDDEPSGDWRTLTPGPGRLTIVGDPKQSIYRFRRADLAVYDQVRNAALRDGQTEITTNFRSNPEMLRALNAIFDQVLQPEPGIQPGNVPLAAPAECVHLPSTARGGTRGVHWKVALTSCVRRKLVRSPGCSCEPARTVGTSVTAMTTTGGDPVGGATWSS